MNVATLTPPQKRKAWEELKQYSPGMARFISELCGACKGKYKVIIVERI